MKKNILISIYGQPENYPPTLNAIQIISKIFTKVYVLYKAHSEIFWDYPKNVILIPSGNIISIENQKNSSIPSKIKQHISFLIKFRELIKKTNFHTILVYDYFPTMSLYFSLSSISKKSILWYHNHDVPSPQKVSIGSLALYTQNKLFSRLDLFTCPSKERFKYFPNNKFKGKRILIKNYPSKALYKNIYVKENNLKKVEFIYQGQVNNEHGLEEISKFIKNKDNFNLNIAGNITSKYQEKLSNILSSSQIKFHGFVAYKNLPKITSSCHIGIAINKPNDIIYQTGGSASNKIYEYAACGLPILYFDNEHYNEYLGELEWAFATDLSKESINICVSSILEDYEYYSKKAKEDFNKIFNFETEFKKATNYLEKK